MQEAKADAGTIEGAELPPSGVAGAILCLREQGYFVLLENLFLYIQVMAQQSRWSKT